MLPTGSHINYYFFCRRKLWFFARGIQCEQDSELVHFGRVIHENSYKDKRKELQFDRIKVDWIDLKNKVVHEVKKSDKAEKAHIWQLKYYLYYLEITGVGKFSGELNYPTMKRKVPIKLLEKDYAKIESYIEKINDIVNQELPPQEFAKRTSCKSCSYFELCTI